MTIHSNNADHICYCVRNKDTRQYYYFSNQRRCWITSNEPINLALFSEQGAHSTRNKIAAITNGPCFSKLEVLPVRLYVEKTLNIESKIS